MVPAFWEVDQGEARRHSHRVKERGILSIGDFSTVLSDSQRGRREQLFSALRRIYDGRYQRDLGNEERPLVWTGRVTLVAACTSAIDNFASHADSLGPRWVYLRMAQRDPATRRRVTSRAVRTNTEDLTEARRRARLLVGDLIRGAASTAAIMKVTEELIRQVEDAAQVVCYGRAQVPRDSGPRREITGLAEIEEPPHVAKQLLMLIQCLIALGLSDQEAIAIMMRVAIDCMPATRALALGAVIRAEAQSRPRPSARARAATGRSSTAPLRTSRPSGLFGMPEARLTGTSSTVRVLQRRTPGFWSMKHADLVRNAFALREHPVLPEVAA